MGTWYIFVVGLFYNIWKSPSAQYPTNRVLSEIIFKFNKSTDFIRGEKKAKYILFLNIFL